ncbi:MAG TPA: OmpA family protein [Allosphingosinicella sp.]|jgi:OOP family OmpA-OmpF porin
MRSGLLAIAAATFISFTTSVPAAACIRQQILYFAPGSTAISQRSEQVLASLVAWIRQNFDGVDGIRVTGHSDSTGSPALRTAISFARAEAVRDKLISYGIPARLFGVQAMGDSEPAIETADGVAEPDSRRVEIIFAMTKAGRKCCSPRLRWDRFQPADSLN